MMSKLFSFSVMSLVVLMYITRALINIFVIPVSDCDEIFNFWEPAHYLSFGRGLQTWEYDALFRLRSWLFLWIHLAPGLLLQHPIRMIAAAIAANQQLFAAVCGVPAVVEAIMMNDKLALYYGVRVGAVALQIAGEVAVCRALRRAAGAPTGVVAGLMFAVSTGFAVAGGSFLPSSFAMMCFTHALAAAMALVDGSPKAAYGQAIRGTIFWVCTAAIVGWPFAGFAALPLALVVIVRGGFFPALKTFVGLAGSISAAVVIFDVYYSCGKFTFSTWNIVKYNVFGEEGRSSTLYGVEEWHFFFKNLFLNFNVLFPVTAFAAPVALMVAGPHTRRCLTLCFAPYFLWFAFWLRVPHKEERFMAPAYPFLVASAALVVVQILKWGARGVTKDHSAGKAKLLFSRFVVAAFFVVFCVVSVSRTAAMVHFYSGAQQSVLMSQKVLAQAAAASTAPTTVCLGKEWYRFPSHFFMPEGVRAGFMKTEHFRGALPLPFQYYETSSTSLGNELLHGANCTCVPNRGPMNDLNKEIQEQYVRSVEKECDFIWDTVKEGPATNLDVPSGNFEVVEQVEATLLDVDSTPQLCRLLYIPRVTEQCARFTLFKLYINSKKKGSHKKEKATR